jgi:hypothetical protein
MNAVKTTSNYPSDEFLRDFEEFQSSQIPNGEERAHFLFTRRYYPDKKAFAFRFNRFVRVVGSVASNIEQLVQDKIVTFDKDGKRQVPQELLLALHEWYCGVDEKNIQTMPPPNWSAVMKIYDRLKAK